MCSRKMKVVVAIVAIFLCIIGVVIIKGTEERQLRDEFASLEFIYNGYYDTEIIGYLHKLGNRFV